MRIRFRILGPLTALLMVLLTPSIASADITAFLGVNGTPSNRLVKGFAVGAGLLVVGFEFEYANTNEDLTDATELAPGLRTFMFNGLVQTPFAIAGFQPYATAGAGGYRETLSAPDISETNVGINVGGGVKMSLAGPLRLRFDYRVLTLKGSPLHPTVQRFYAGVNLKF
jgi:opacity protein-like surface antigen